MRVNKKLLNFLLIGSLALTACSKSSDSATASPTGGGGEVDSSFSGTLSSTTFHLNSGLCATPFAIQDVTHVMAVSPSTSNVERFVAEVGSDGSFNLPVSSGKPYIIVFVAQDGTLTGPNMMVATVKVASNDLDTMALAQASDVDLGELTEVACTTNVAISTTVADLTTSLGITEDEADFIGGIDDLALRLSNPDVDNNGVIDALEDKNFMMDIHVRADTKLGASNLLLTDIENVDLDSFSTATLSVDWTLGSFYAVFPTSFSDTAWQGDGATLATGGAFTATDSGTNSIDSYSGGTFDVMRQWGPDYNMSTGELGGSAGATTFTFTMGDKELIYSNVRSKTKAQLNSDGVVLPLVAIRTSGGIIQGIDYKWIKRSGGAWVAATATEVGMIAQESGAYLMLYTEKGSGVEKGLSFSIPPTSASGSIDINGEGFDNREVEDPTQVALADVCSTAMSYDDKMGLRLFAGAPSPASVTCP